MKNSNQQPPSAISLPVGLITGNSKPERALSTKKKFFQTIASLDATMSGSHSNSCAGAAYPKAWASTLNEMANDDKNAGKSENWIHITTAKADALVSRISKEQLKSLIHVEVVAAVETAQ